MAAPPTCRNGGLRPAEHVKDPDGRLVCPRSLYEESPTRQDRVAPGTSYGDMRYDAAGSRER